MQHAAKTLGSKPLGPKPHASGHADAEPPVRERVLYIIDDDEADRRRLIDLLRDGRYGMHVFDSGADFLSQHMPLEDACVLLDVWMPKMDGLSVLKHISDACPACPVIMLSGRSTLPIAVQAMKRGAIDFLEKPVARDSLFEALERALSIRPPVARPEALTRDALLNKVTRREGQVLELLVRGHPNKVVAFELGIAENTVEVHRHRLMQRLDVKSFAELVRLAVKAGF
jgi:two-component system, LuxR family, response regulator FixJ